MPLSDIAVQRRPRRGSSPLDFEREAARIDPSTGAQRSFARNGVRTFFGPDGGSGTSDLVRYGDDVILSVINCVLEKTTRWDYEPAEPMVMLRASLCCDIAFRFDGIAPVVFDRPELVLFCVPAGRSMDAEIVGGARQQGIVAVFRAATFAARYGLADADLPQVMRDAMKGRGSIGRIASFPLDHRLAALVADTIDTRLDGELRVVQYAGRLAELVAYALDAMADKQVPVRAVLQRRRDVDLAHAAHACLQRDFRRPPLFAELARDIGTNQNKLKALFKGAYGVTMADYCLERRMREAQQLLLEATLTIGQVAERVGYEHQSSFTAAFRGHVGMSPREYRRHRAPLSLPLEPLGPIA